MIWQAAHSFDLNGLLRLAPPTIEKHFGSGYPGRGRLLFVFGNVRQSFDGGFGVLTRCVLNFLQTLRASAGVA